MKLLTTIYSKGENYAANVILDPETPLNGKPSIFFFGDCDNDVDGTPHWMKDPTGQNSTSLKYEGKPLNGDIIPFIVIPQEIANLSPEMFLGCAGYMEWNSGRVSVVVGDAGPHNKVGEASPAALKAVGAPTLDNGNGGIDKQEVLFRIWPGVPANLFINNVSYQFVLKPWGT